MSNHVPTCVIKFNGSRIKPEREAEIRVVRLFDKLNDPSVLFIEVDDEYHEWCNDLNISEGTEVKVQMGYKDDIAEVFHGEIVAFKAHFSSDHGTVFTVEARDFSQRITSVSMTMFKEMKLADIYAEVADKYGLKVEADDIGPEYERFLPPRMVNEYDWIQLSAANYGCDVWCRGKTLYIKKLQPNQGEDVVVEKGKGIKYFEAEHDARCQMDEVKIHGYNVNKNESIDVSIKLDSIDKDLKSRLDGNDFKKYQSFINTDIIDMTVLETFAEGMLVKQAQKYTTGTCIVGGNYKIRAGTILKIKGFAETFNNLYYVVKAVHILNNSGYVTEIYFKRYVGTAMPAKTGTFESSSSSASSSAGTKNESTKAGAGSDSSSASKEKSPQINNLQWKHDGQNVTKAHVDDKVHLTADVTDIDDGVSIRLTINEKDSVGEDDFIARKNTKVKSGKIEFEWEVEYHEDKDDANSEEEQNEKGYTLPEYVFIAEYLSKDVKSGESPVLEVYGWIGLKVMDETLSAVSESISLKTKDDSTKDLSSMQDNVLKEVAIGDVKMKKSTMED